MVCEYCGRQFAQLPENGVCPGCGAVVQNTEDLTTIPYGRYKLVNSAITLYETGFFLEHKALSKEYTTQIPYDQIKAVFLSVLEKDSLSSIGYMIIRWTENQEVAIPERKRYCLDLTGVCYGQSREDFIYHLFYTLKMLAPASAVFTVVGLEESITKQVSLLGEFADSLYQQHKLCRKAARKVLRRQFGMKKTAAMAVVNRVFFEKETECYNADLKEALRDLNRILRKQ